MADTKNMKEGSPGSESYEQVGEDLSRTTVGELILRADEFGERLDALGEEGAAKAMDHAVAPNEPVDDTVWEPKAKT